jgi:hypothetical protein
MGLLNDLTPPKREWPCAVRSMVESLDKDDATILSDAVLNPDWKYLALESALALKGIVLSQGVIKRHRTKVCSCWKG